MTRTRRRKRLKQGFSTGSAAAAAAQAALTALLTGRDVDRVTIGLPDGGDLNIEVAQTSRAADRCEAWATVIKDAGDDPDVTHRAAISARVRLLDEGPGESIDIRGGEGVGRITRPGLPIDVGQAAINPVPRQMIADEIRRAWAAHGAADNPARVMVEISVADGEKLAKRTLNPRLGIIGGISILGTTGLVKPFSHEAYTATIESALDVAQAMGIDEVVLTTGGRSEKRAMDLRPDLPEQAFVQIADFFGFSLGELRKRKLVRAGLVSFFGKAVKQAQGLEYTHAHKAPMDLARLASWLREDGAPPSLAAEMAVANTARHALEVLKAAGALEYTASVGRRMTASARELLGPAIGLWTKIIDYDGTVLYEQPPEDGAT